MSVIVLHFITLDGIVSDPDGSDGTPAGGWAFRHGPGTVAGDKFRLGSVLDDGVMLLGRATWQLFSRLWPPRDDPFSARMNAVPKLVASRTLADTSAWANSRVIDGDVIDAVKREQRDVIITGSLSVVHALMARDLIDEYRLLTFPTILGTGERLFPPAARPGTWSACRPGRPGPPCSRGTGGRTMTAHFPPGRDGRPGWPSGWPAGPVTATAATVPSTSRAAVRRGLARSNSSPWAHQV